MLRIFTTIKNYWEKRRQKKRFAAMLAPEYIGSEAQRLLHLVELSLCNGHLSGSEAHHLQSLQEEMSKLILLTEKEEFRQLPEERRRSLHESLLRSQEKLIHSIQRAEAPTARMQ